MAPDDQVLLAGDIGGTKTTLAIYHPKAGPRSPLVKMTFPSARYASLYAVVEDFLHQINRKINFASFGIAGPIFRGKATVTNLPWVIDESNLGKQLQAPVHLLNDLQAIAIGLPFLEANDLETINTGTPDPQGGLAVIAPGTGLGEAFLLWSLGRFNPYPSEGGHADFAPASPLELQLLAYLQPRMEHVSYERICSGIGIPNIYAFFRDTGKYAEPDWLKAKLAQGIDPVPVIVQTALERRADICVATLDLFVTVLASEAGNLALRVLATGGVYLGGGLPPRILPFIHPESFMQTFKQKGRMTEMLARVPVSIIRNPEVALFGAACHGFDFVREHA